MDKENKWNKWCHKIVESDVTQLVISILVGGAIFLIKDNLYGQGILEAALASCITYIIIYILKNPYGKFKILLENYSERDKNQSQALNEIRLSIDNLKDNIEKLQQVSLKELDEKEKKSDNMISVLVRHLSNEAYGKCKNRVGNCNICSRYVDGCSGLLRSYLYEDCQKLAKAIEESKTKHSYRLNTDISFYHTLAIDQMISMEGVCYRVIQSLLNEKNPVFDKMDIDFMHIFLQKLKENNYAKNKNFKVKWIFVGQHRDQIPKINYSYLVEELQMDENKEMRDIFEFRTISSRSYGQLRDSNRKLEDTPIASFFSQQPSLGIFDKIFVFVDAAPNEDEHGVMYTDQKDVDNLIKFYEMIWGNNDIKETKFSELQSNLRT